MEGGEGWKVWGRHRPMSHNTPGHTPVAKQQRCGVTLVRDLPRQDIASKHMVCIPIGHQQT